VTLPARVLQALEQARGSAGVPKRSSRADGWGSLLTGLGTTRDKRESHTFGATRVTDVEARELWRGDDLAANAIEMYPAEMLRAGFCVKVYDEDPDKALEMSELIDGALEDLNVAAIVQEALCWERAFGGCGSFIVCNDGSGDLSKPLNEKKIVKLEHLANFEPRELQAHAIYTDPRLPKFNTPSVYRMQPMNLIGGNTGPSLLVHESRFLIFPGIKVSRGATTQHPGWGDSELSRVIEVIRDFNVGFAAASHLLVDFAQAVIKIQGLKAAIAADETDAIKARMEIMDISRSIVRAIMLDAGEPGSSPEEFHRESTSVTGVPEMLDRMIYRLASALKVPATLLMGMSPAGLNATGASDIQLFYDRVRQAQQKHLKPRLERLVSLLLRSTEGPTGGKEPEKWTIEFHPLVAPSQEEIVNTRKVQADIDAVYVGLGADPIQILKSRFGGDAYSHETKLDFAELEKIQKAEQERAAAMQAAGLSDRASGAGSDDALDEDPPA
jgi:phage-related protein (TIGR01555 family)